MKISQIEVVLIDHMGSDQSVVNAARVSFAKASENYTLEQNNKLIKYLAKHKHTSPFNHAFISVRVKAPIFVARQLVKHKFMPWNEISRRYVDEEPEFFIPEYWRGRSKDVKQGSDGKIEETDQTTFSNWQRDDCNNSLSTYRQMIGQGVCPEQARMVLPLNTITEWVWSGSLGAFADMLRLRLDPHTQKESRDVAELIYALIKPLYPESIAALLENN